MPQANLSSELLLAFESVPDPYLILSDQLQVQTASDVYLQTFGVSREDLVGRMIGDIFQYEEPQGGTLSNKILQNSLDKVVSSGKPHEVTLDHYDLSRSKNMDLDPSSSNWICTHIPVMHPDGGVHYIIHKVGRNQETGSDFITLKAALDQAPIGLGIYQGEDLIITSANQKICDMWGHSSDQVLNKPLLEGVPELQGQGFDELLLQVMHSGKPFVGKEFSARLLREGKLTASYFNFVYQPLYNQLGKAVGIINIAVEVTELVKARQEAEQQNEQLHFLNEKLSKSNEELLTVTQSLEELNKELEKRVEGRTKAMQVARQEAEKQKEILKKLFEELPFPVAVLKGEQLTFDLVNPAYQQIFQDRLLLGKPVVEALPEIVGTSIPDILQKVYETGESFVAQEMALNLARSQKGEIEECFFTFIYQAQYDHHEKINGVLVLAHEVTSQVRSRQVIAESEMELASINEELQAANEEVLSGNNELSRSNFRLTQINTELDNFIYTASHDLKAPIANIEGLLNTLVGNLSSESLQKPIVNHVVAMINKSIQRFQRTIYDLTEISKIQREDLVSDRGKVNIGEVIKEVLQDLEVQIKQSGAIIEIDDEHCGPLVFSAKNARSIIYNLLSNSIKYRSPERTLHLVITCYNEAEYLVLSVEDNGIGMDTSQEHKIFGMFKRLHTHVEGTGVGLYIVKKIIENAQGKIELRSTIGEGTRFRIFFPSEDN